MKQNKNRGVGAARGGVYFFKGAEAELRAATDVWHIKNRKRKKWLFVPCRISFCSQFWEEKNEFTALQMAYMSFICCSSHSPQTTGVKSPIFGGGPISHRFVSRESIKKEDPWPILINMEVHA